MKEFEMIMDIINKLMWIGLLFVGGGLLWRRFIVQRYGESIVLQKVEVKKVNQVKGIHFFVVTYIYGGKIYTRRSVEVGIPYFGIPRVIYNQKGKRHINGNVSCDDIWSTEVIALTLVFAALSALFQVKGFRY